MISVSSTAFQLAPKEVPPVAGVRESRELLLDSGAMQSPETIPTRGEFCRLLGTEGTGRGLDWTGLVLDRGLEFLGVDTGVTEVGSMPSTALHDGGAGMFGLGLLRLLDGSATA